MDLWALMALSSDQPMKAQRVENDRLKVFISYSRHDSRFAAELIAGLGYDGGFEVLIDRHSIHEGEEWRARLAALVVEADSVIVVLTPSWLRSKVCIWEIEEAWKHSKRIVPVQALPLDGEEVPARISAINYVRFDQEKDAPPRLFMDGMAALRRALNTDLGWVREHSRLFARAAEWETAGRVGNRMLVGSDIGAAKRWLDDRPKGAPEPTELHRDYIAASEQAEASRLSVERKRVETLQRLVKQTRVALAATLVLAIAAGAAGVYATAKKRHAQIAEIKARDAEQEASTERDAALVVQSRHLADLAARQTAMGDAATAMLLALSGLPEYGSAPASSAARQQRPYVAELEGRLYESYFENHERIVLGRHTGSVLSAAFSSDGQRIVTGSTDQTLRLWNAATGQESLLVQGHQGPVTGVALSPKGDFVVSGSGDTTARISETTSGRLLHELKGHTGEILDVAISADGKRVATASDDGTAAVWSSESGERLAVLSGHAGPVNSVAITRDGTTVVTGSSDATAIIWDVASRQPRHSLKEHALLVRAVAFSADGRRVVTGSEDKTIRIWDAATGRQLTALSSEQAPSSMTVDATVSRVATGAGDGTIRLWSVAEGVEIERITGHEGSITSVRFSPDGRQLVSSSQDGTARVWSIGSGTESRTLDGHSGAVSAVAITADGTRVVTGGRDRTARIWNGA